jgi:hypothetical protein
MYKVLLLAVIAFALIPQNAMAQGTMPSASPSTLSPNAFEVTPSPASEQLDYHLLYNNTFDKVDLDQAKGAHLSDTQVAKIYLLARDGGCEFRDVYALVRDGYSFAELSDIYGVNLGSRERIQHAQDDIDAYRSAYAGTGQTDAPRPNRVESSIDSVNK